ncbi:ATP-binding cassette domain-containing protein [Thiohalobacter sp. IOR34]|uniref:ABC transporter ATP-binding protein n=1 Tax=Thiohalobacter sp. IOR34 TaxID=3057176 RepID=UPI0025B08D3B|nr:ATP-binding cassette domain-containing protein [Thiohalobacter sp. IOR34]WJW75758.1 ATP-binding cassette domain-containing protein [Thiohalobacter sp. IOR34]
MDREILIRAQQLYRYYGPNCAVRDLSFELAKGDVLGFLGPNGAGKSSTMQMLTGNLAPSAGRIEVHGIDLLDRPKAAKRELGYLPEQPPLYRELTVDEYLTYCARLHRVPRRAIRRAVDSARERCGLEAVGRRLIGNLSKGYQQRVGIAQAILHTPAVVILDEPTVGLDPIQIREIRALIRELGREHGIILSTHILPEVESTCNRVQIIHRGRLVFSDSMHGLQQQLHGGQLLVALRTPPPAGTLAALPGVDDVEALTDGRFRIAYNGESPAEAIAEHAVAGGWGLQALIPERRTLEQIFIELTARDPGAEDEAA